MTTTIFFMRDGAVQTLTAIIEREADGYVSFCPELDIASQGDTIEDVREALQLFFESASPAEIIRVLRAH